VKGKITRKKIVQVFLKLWKEKKKKVLTPFNNAIFWQEDSTILLLWRGVEVDTFLTLPRKNKASEVHDRLQSRSSSYPLF